MKDRYQTKFWLKVLSSFCLLGVCIYITYQIKKCVYIIKKKACVYMCVWGVVLINILMLQLGPPKQKFLTSPLHLPNTSWTLTFLYMQLCMAAEVILQIVTLNLLPLRARMPPLHWLIRLFPVVPSIIYHISFAWQSFSSPSSEVTNLQDSSLIYVQVIFELNY